MIRFIDHGFQVFFEPQTLVDQYTIRYVVYDQVCKALNEWKAILNSSNLPTCLQKLVMQYLGGIKDRHNVCLFYMEPPVSISAAIQPHTYCSMILEGIILYHYGIFPDLVCHKAYMGGNAIFHKNPSQCDVSLWPEKMFKK